MPVFGAGNLAHYAMPDEDPQKIQETIESLSRGDVHVIGFSGKKASGKDTLAEIFKSKFEASHGKAEFAPFAKALKGEATQMIMFIHQWAWGSSPENQHQMIQRFASLYNISLEEAKHIYNLVISDITLSDEPFDGWTRTDTVWKLLRYLGTEVRQPQDRIYWVRRTVRTIIVNAANGISTIVQDARFIHEADALKDMGAYLARVDISPEAQAIRLGIRDNVVADDDSRQHLSETGLDDYRNFDIRVDNSADGQQQVAAEKIFTAWKMSRHS